MVRNITNSCFWVYLKATRSHHVGSAQCSRVNSRAQKRNLLSSRLTCKLIIKTNVTRRSERPELSPSNYANAAGLGDRRRRDHRASCRDGLHRIRPFNRSTLVMAANFAKLPEPLRKAWALILITPMDLSRLMWRGRCLVCAVLYAEPSFAHRG